MGAFREQPPSSLAGISVKQIRDYQSATTTPADGGAPAPLTGPSGNLVILDLEEEGNYVAVRPSGTEPKIKLYVFTRLASAASQDTEAAEKQLERRVSELEQDIRRYAKENS